MTEQQKAKELVEKFKQHSHGYNKGTLDHGNHHAKQSALICLEEMINQAQLLADFYENSGFYIKEKVRELQQVKTEIEKL